MKIRIKIVITFIFRFHRSIQLVVLVPVGRLRHRWEDDIRMDLEEIDINAGNWVDSAQDRDYWRDLVNVALNLQVPLAMELVIQFTCSSTFARMAVFRFYSSSERILHKAVWTIPICSGIATVIQGLFHSFVFKHFTILHFRSHLHPWQTGLPTTWYPLWSFVSYFCFWYWAFRRQSDRGLFRFWKVNNILFLLEVI